MVFREIEVSHRSCDKIYSPASEPTRDRVQLFCAYYHYYTLLCAGLFCRSSICSLFYTYTSIVYHWQPIFHLYYIVLQIYSPLYLHFLQVLNFAASTIAPLFSPKDPLNVFYMHSIPQLHFTLLVIFLCLFLRLLFGTYFAQNQLLVP